MIISHTQIKLGKYMLIYMFNTLAKYYKINKLFMSYQEEIVGAGATLYWYAL